MSILHGCCIEILKTLKEKSIHSCVTSPPYFGLRDYGTQGQIGLETTPEEYISKILEVFSQVKRVLRDDGTLWLNLGDSYWNNFGGGSSTMTTGNSQAVKTRGRSNKPKHSYLKIKDLIGIPWLVALALQKDGWYLRQDIIWHKPNSLPESVTDRCSKSHEYIFLLSKSPKYYFDNKSIKVPMSANSTPSKSVRGKNPSSNAPLGQPNQLGSGSRGCDDGLVNKRSVWTVTTKPFKEAHFATFPIDLIEPCIIAGCPENGTVLDPFFGAGTTGIVCIKNKRNYLGIELNQDYIDIAKKRISDYECKSNL